MGIKHLVLVEEYLKRIIKPLSRTAIMLNLKFRGDNMDFKTVCEAIEYLVNNNRLSKVTGDSKHKGRNCERFIWKR